MKNFQTIKKEIDLLTNDEEIEKYVKNRLDTLEEGINEETIGQGYTDSYDGYIGLKTHYKAMASNDNYKCPDLKYDYIQPYIDLVKNIKNKGHNELTILNEIFYLINNLSDLSHSEELSRGLTYLSAIQRNESVSIKTIFDNDCAFCSERSGMAQNLLVFLGIDSKLVTGYRNDEPHAYNIVFPKGYENEPMFLFDTSHFVNFKSEDHRYSLAYFYGMNNEKYKELISGKQYKIELSKTESFYRNMYGFGNDYTFDGSEPKYTFGLTKKNSINQQEELNTMFLESNLEKGVDKVNNNIKK